MLRSEASTPVTAKPSRRHRLAQQAAAAADVKQGQAPKAAGPPGRDRTAPGLFADELQPDRIEPVQRRELAVWIPPLAAMAEKRATSSGSMLERASAIGALLDRAIAPSTDE